MKKGKLLCGTTPRCKTLKKRMVRPAQELFTAIRWRAQSYTIEIWLILPVVICLFQGLSHACLRITALQESAHGSLHQT